MDEGKYKTEMAFRLMEAEHGTDYGVNVLIPVDAEVAGIDLPAELWADYASTREERPDSATSATAEPSILGSTSPASDKAQPAANVREETTRSATSGSSVLTPLSAAPHLEARHQFEKLWIPQVDGTVEDEPVHVAKRTKWTATSVNAKAQSKVTQPVSAKPAALSLAQRILAAASAAETETASAFAVAQASQTVPASSSAEQPSEAGDAAEPITAPDEPASKRRRRRKNKSGEAAESASLSPAKNDEEDEASATEIVDTKHFKEIYYGKKFGKSANDAQFIRDLTQAYVRGW